MTPSGTITRPLNTWRLRPDFWIRSYNGQSGCHNHAFHQFLLCMDGHLDVYTEADEFILTRNTGLLVSRRHTHDYIVPDTASLLVVDVAVGVWGDLERALGEQGGTRALPNSNDIISLLAYAHAEARPSAETWQPSDHYLDAFVAAIAGILQPVPDDRITAVLGRLEASHRTVPGTDTLATQVGLSPSQLNRLFRKHLGQPPARLARSRRLRHAEQLLTCTNRPIAEIAAACGYSDQATFTRAFSREFGRSPARSRDWHGRSHSDA